MTMDWKEYGSKGRLGLSVSHMSGSGKSALETVKLFENLGREGLSRSHLFSMGAHLFGCAMALDNLGTASQKDQWLPGLTSGETVGALAFTGPDSGSRTDDVGVTYKDGDDIILSGTKTYVTNGPEAGLFIVSANRAEKPSSLNLGLFVVPRNNSGIEITALDTYGLKASSMAKVVFNEVKIPSDYQLGSRGTGGLLSVMVWERSCILAGFLGALEKDLNNATTHFRSTRDKDGPLFRHQGISHVLAQIRADLEAARQTLYHGAQILDEGGDTLKSSAISKLIVSQTLVRGQQKLCELMAGRAWLGEMDLADALSDVMGVLAASGSSNVQLNAIAARM